MMMFCLKTHWKLLVFQIDFFFVFLLLYEDMANNNNDACVVAVSWITKIFNSNVNLLYVVFCSRRLDRTPDDTLNSPHTATFYSTSPLYTTHANDFLMRCVCLIKFCICKQNQQIDRQSKILFFL